MIVAGLSSSPASIAALSSLLAPSSWVLQRLQVELPSCSLLVAIVIAASMPLGV